MNKFFLETYGCQMNVAESNALQMLLEGSGWVAAQKQEDADLAIINTCSVRQSAENRIRGRLSSYAPLKKRKKLTLVLTGCMAERLKDSVLKDCPYIDYVVSVNDKMKIMDIAQSISKSDSVATVRKGFVCSDNCYSFASCHYKEGEFSSFVPIMNGCDNFCSYCIVPYVRGREMSRDLDSIIDEVKMLDSKKVREITLLGQNVNSYNYKGVDFPALLEKICSEVNNIQWIRFESPHPKDFSDRLIDVIAGQQKIAKHLHIPMQSGNTRILSLMNRKYTREDYLKLIDKIKDRIKDVTFALDVMVGFPSETEEEFKDTLSAMSYVSCIEAYMYYYNPREGTRAVKMDGQLDLQVKQNRLQRLIDFQLKNAAEIKEKRTGNIQDVLVVSDSRDSTAQMLGRNEHNEMVVFDVDSKPVKPGDFVRVRFNCLNGNTFVGSQV